MYKLDVHDVEGRSAIRAIADAENEENPGTWEFTELRFSHFFVLPEGLPDMQVADMTNGNGDGIIEFKSKFDFVGSFYNDGNGLAETLKCMTPGQPAVLIIYDKPGQSDYLYCKKVPNGELHLEAARLELLSTQARAHHINRGFSVTFVASPEEAVRAAKSFLRKCRLLPKRFPMPSLVKGEDLPVQMFSVLPTFGPEYIKNLLDDIGERRGLERLVRSTC